MTTDTSIAHRLDPQARRFHPDGNVPWRAATPPDISAGKTIGSLRACDFCGSMHPADVAAAIRAGAVGHWADRKYGWPHKAYFDAIPNPHVGQMESYTSCYAPPQAEIDAGKWVQVPDGFSRINGAPQLRWVQAGQPAPATTHGKFYTVHLQDATPEDRETIERHLGLAFEFDERGISWQHPKLTYGSKGPDASVEHHPV